MPSPPPTVRGAAAALSLVLALPAATAAQGVFGPAERWEHRPGPGQPWIPADVALAAGGELCWAAPAVATPHLLALSGPVRRHAEVLFADRGVGPVAGSFEVAAGERPDVLLTLVQRPAPDALHRRTEVRRYDPLAAAVAGGPFDPVWTHDLGTLGNAPARLACDARGDRLVAAVHDPAAGHVQLDWLDAEDGALRHRELVPAASLRRLELSADGRRALLSAGLGVWVLEESGVVHHEPLQAATDGVALAADGASFAVGQPGSARLLREGTGGFATAWSRAAPAHELAARLALSADGGTLAVGWWNAADAVSARFEWWDCVADVRLFERPYPGVPGGLQNFPQALEVTADGRRAAFGAWGDGDADPEVFVVDRDLGEVLRADLPGSVLALDLSPDGTRLAVAGKDVHANQVGTTGSVRLYDTGERSVQVLGQARLGGTVRVRAARPAATRAVFLVGVPAAAPSAVPGVSGELLLDRDAGVASHAVPADAQGRAALTLRLPDDPAWLGRRLGVQVAFRTPAGTVLSPELALPVVLD